MATTTTLTSSDDAVNLEAVESHVSTTTTTKSVSTTEPTTIDLEDPVPEVKYFEIDGLTLMVPTTLDELPDRASTISVIPDFVIDSGDGPVVCLTGARMSSPPQCSGPHLIGLEMSTLPDTQTTGETTWTESPVRFTGSWDGRNITLTEPPEFDPVRPAEVIPERPKAPERTDTELQAVWDEILPVMEEGRWGSVAIEDGWLVVTVGIVDKQTARLFAQAASDASPLLLVGLAEVSQ
jgi:hypothetical protein